MNYNKYVVEIVYAIFACDCFFFSCYHYQLDNLYDDTLMQLNY